MASIALSFIDSENGVVTSTTTLSNADISRIYKALATHYNQNDKDPQNEYTSQMLVDRFRDSIIQNLINTAHTIELQAAYDQLKLDLVPIVTQ